MKCRGLLLALLTAVFVLVIGAGMALTQVSLSALPEPGPVETYMATQAKRLFVSRRAHGVSPAPPNDAATLANGRMQFGGNCASCHGYDGRTPTAMGRSLYPPAPDLGSSAVQKYSDAELFWVVKNGIRLTGMPGFGRILSDQDIWALVHYVRSLEAASQVQAQPAAD